MENPGCLTCKSQQGEGSVGEECGVDDEETAGEVGEQQPGDDISKLR